MPGQHRGAARHRSAGTQQGSAGNDTGQCLRAHADGIWMSDFLKQNSVTSHEMVRIDRMIPYMHEYYIHGTVG